MIHGAPRRTWVPIIDAPTRLRHEIFGPQDPAKAIMVLPGPTVTPDGYSVAWQVCAWRPPIGLGCCESKVGDGTIFGSEC